MSVDVAPVYRFGRFELDADRRLLSAGGETVAIGARAFDILVVLVRHRDRVVTKDELLDTVWRGTVVEENNLAVHVSALRRALGERVGGDRFIATVPGSGYRFVSAVTEGPLTVLEAGSGRVAIPAPEMPPEADLPVVPAPARGGRTSRRIAIGLTATGLFAIAIVLIAGLTGVPGLAPRLSIAVLPFRSLGGGGRAYFADAVTDDLTTELAHIPRSIVLARGSADALTNSGEHATTMGRALKVRYLLRGSILDEGATLHVNAQLIETKGGANLWTDAFDVARGDLGGSLGDIVQRVSSAVRFTLVQEEGKRSLRERPKDPDALDLYLRAKSVLDETNDFAGLVEVQELLERSLRTEPDASDVLAELGLVLVRKVAEFDDPNSDGDLARARVVVGRAVDLAPENIPSVVARGMLAWYDYRTAQAEADFRLVLKVNASNVEAHWGLAHLAHDRGDMATMISELNEISRLDPLSPKRDQCDQMLGRGYLMLGKPAEALSWFARAESADSRERQDSALDWRDWRRIFTIAATYLIGDKEHAAALWHDYDRHWPHRTVALLASYDTRSLSVLPGDRNYLRALGEVGMPMYAPEDEDLGVPASSSIVAGGILDPTPMSIPGAARITTAEVATMLADGRKPAILDFGLGRNMIANAALMPNDQSISALTDALNGLGLLEGHFDQPVIVMGSGPFGWSSYNGALRLLSLGFHHVFWYRGGEEAWTAAGHPTEDRRPD